MATALYTRDILRLASSIPHLGRLTAPQGSAERRSLICGSRVIVDVVLDAAGRVADIGHEVRACALGQASAAVMGMHVVGRSADEIAEARDALAAYLSGERSDPGSWPGLDQFEDARSYSARHAAILLPFQAAAEAAALARN